jgi:hypothetical protein
MISAAWNASIGVMSEAMALQNSQRLRTAGWLNGHLRGVRPRADCPRSGDIIHVAATKLGHAASRTEATWLGLIANRTTATVVRVGPG